MADENEKCDCRWTANNVASIIAAIGSSIAVVMSTLNHRSSEENGAKIQAVQSEAADVKTDLRKRSDDVDRKLERVQRTTEKVDKNTVKTAEKVGASPEK